VTQTIQTIQARINALGFGPLVVDGAFGPCTRAAVKEFQATKGLVPDGIPGPLTRAALFGAMAFPPNPGVLTPTEMTWLT
jgi:peptidoglycan hydrolase-like protein with peptidoglycan-binding domain